MLPILPTADFADFAGSADSKPTLPNQPTLSRGLPLPQCLNQRCFVSVSPGRIFLPGLSSPCSSKNLRCRFSPTSPQLHKSAQPIFPVGGSHATAPMSRPAVFFVKPWTAQSRDPGNAAGPHPSLRDAVPLEGLGGGTNRSDMGLNLSGSWQQGHSATYNTPSRI